MGYIARPQMKSKVGKSRGYHTKDKEDGCCRLSLLPDLIN